MTGKTKFDIDAVISWVDGDDPEHRAKRRLYGDKSVLGDDEIGGEIRYKSIGEIRYCVASLYRFAPWLRKIFIITDNQDPCLGDFISKAFPDSSISLEIVDHSVIFRGHEDVLPVFDARSIETVMWRIPGLSEHFLYLNDDFTVIAPISPEDFFVEDKVVAYGRWFSVKFSKLLRKLKPRAHGHVKASFRDSMVKAADAVGEKHFFLRLNHTPHALKVSTYASFFGSRPDVFRKNLSFRFRDKEQFNPAELAFLLEKQAGRLIRRPVKGNRLYLKPHGEAYMKRHIKRFTGSTKEKFCCANSLPYASPEDQRAVLDWLESRIGVKIDL